MRVLKFLMKVLLTVGVILLFMSACVVFMVSGDTKLAGVVFLCSGLWGFLEMTGKVKTGVFRESNTSLIIGTVGGILLGLILLFR